MIATPSDGELGGEGRAGPTLQDIKPSHLGVGGASAPRRRCRRQSRMRSVPPMAPPPPRSSLLHAPRKPHPATLWDGNKKTHFRSTRLQCRLLSKASRDETNREKETPESQIGARPLPRNFYVVWPWGRTPLPPRVFDICSASAVNSVWIGPFFDQKDPPTVRCAWEAVRSLFTLKNAASHPPTLTGYIIWG